MGVGKQPRRLLISEACRLPRTGGFKRAPVQHASVVSHQPIFPGVRDSTLQFTSTISVPAAQAEHVAQPDARFHQPAVQPQRAPQQILGPSQFARRRQHQQPVAQDAVGSQRGLKLGRGQGLVDRAAQRQQIGIVPEQLDRAQDVRDLETSA